VIDLLGLVGATLTRGGGRSADGGLLREVPRPHARRFLDFGHWTGALAGAASQAQMARDSGFRMCMDAARGREFSHKLMQSNATRRSQATQPEACRMSQAACGFTDAGALFPDPFFFGEPTMPRFPCALALATCLAMPASADPFIDAMETAIEAYRDGDLQYAEDELAHARQILGEMKAQGLAAFLPEAPDGWDREIDTEAAQMMGFMGGGTSAKATYSGPDGRFELSFIADNPMVAQMGMMLGNATMIAQMGGQVERINRVRFLREDRSLRAIVGNRVLVQAEGADAELMIPVISEIDFRALEAFGS